MVQATSCKTEKNSSERALEGQMFHSRRNLKPTSTPHGMDFGRIQRVRTHAFTLTYCQSRNHGRISQSTGWQVKSHPEKLQTISLCRLLLSNLHCRPGLDSYSRMPRNCLGPNQTLHQWYCRIKSPNSRYPTSENHIQQ